MNIYRSLVGSVMIDAEFSREDHGSILQLPSGGGMNHLMHPQTRLN
jgi:hypothetical protein